MGKGRHPKMVWLDRLAIHFVRENLTKISYTYIPIIMIVIIVGI